MCFVFIWEQTATCATYSINWLVFITERKSVYCAVRTGSLNKTVCASYLKGCHSYSKHFLFAIFWHMLAGLLVLYQLIFSDIGHNWKDVNRFVLNCLTLNLLTIHFYGAFKIAKETLIFVMSISSTSYRRLGTIRSPLDGFSWNLTFKNF